MSDNNGNGRAPLAFQPKPAIPIIGQPFEIRGWFPTVLLVCNCDGKQPVMVPRGAAAQCSSCERLYTIQQLKFTPDGKVNFGIGIMSPEDAATLASGGTLDGKT